MVSFVTTNHHSKKLLAALLLPLPANSRNMFSGEYLSSKKHHPLDFLQRIEDEWGSYMPETIKERIYLLKTEFKFMDMFLSIQSFTDKPNMLTVTQKVHALFQDSAFDVSKIYQNLNRLTSLLQNKIRVTKMEIRANYSFFSEISLQHLLEKSGVDNSEFVMKFINGVVENVSELAEMDDLCCREIQEVLKELKLLKSLVGFLSNRWYAEPQSVRTFFGHVLFVAGSAAMVVWLYIPSYDNNRDHDLVPGEMSFLLSYLVRMRIKPVNPCIRKIYVDVLQVLKWTMQSELSLNIQNVYVAEIEAGFVEILMHNLEEIRSISTLSRIEFLNHQMATLVEMLKFLRASLIHLPKLGLEFHLKDIDTISIDVGLLVYSLYDSEEQDEEVNHIEEDDKELKS